MYDHTELDGNQFDHYFEWGPAKNRPHHREPRQQQQQQQRQALDQRDVSEQRPDDN